ncbi:hypothetical protein DERF_008343 [Dermatophagoides farinae]|uniref:Uncharacterized protein n=1 Tax=Dermatophagoides farinae TaxID=6954 RepID=A0A922I265_DERFA|nr:hypothetical protein DERF_008343 [Dermatophagoides farinae]
MKILLTSGCGIANCPCIVYACPPAKNTGGIAGLGRIYSNCSWMQNMLFVIESAEPDNVTARSVEFVDPVTVTIRSGHEPSEIVIFAPLYNTNTSQTNKQTEKLNF